MDLNDAERYAVAALFTLALHSTHVESGVDKDGNALAESDIAWGSPSEDIFEEQLLSRVPLRLPPELLDLFWGFDCMAPAGLAPRLYAWLKIPRKAWPGLLRMPDLAGCAGSAEAVEAFVTLVRRYSAFLDPELDFTTGHASRLQQHFTMPAAVAAEGGDHQEDDQQAPQPLQQQQQQQDAAAAAGTATAAAAAGTAGSRGQGAGADKGSKRQGILKASSVPESEAVAAAAASLTAAAIAAEASDGGSSAAAPNAGLPAAPADPTGSSSSTPPPPAGAEEAPDAAAAAAAAAADSDGLGERVPSTAAASASFDALHEAVDVLPKEADEGTVVPTATFTPAETYKHTTSHKAVLALYELIGGCVASNTEADMEPLFAVAAQEAECAAFAAAAAKGNKKALKQFMDMQQAQQQQQQQAAASAAAAATAAAAGGAGGSQDGGSRPAAAWFPDGDGDGCSSSQAADSNAGGASSSTSSSKLQQPQPPQPKQQPDDPKQQQQQHLAQQVQGLASVQWYDARARVALKRVAHWLRVPWPQVRAFEQMWAAQALSLDAGSAQPKYDNNRRTIQYLKVGAAAVGGGALLAVTGGLAAPAIAAGLGAAVTLAHGGAAVAGAVTAFAGSTAGTAAVTGLFGAWGASVGGGSARTLYGEVTEFGFWDVSQSIYLDGKGPQEEEEAEDAAAAAAAAAEPPAEEAAEGQEKQAQEQSKAAAAPAAAGGQVAPRLPATPTAAGTQASSSAVKQQQQPERQALSPQQQQQPAPASPCDKQVQQQQHGASQPEQQEQQQGQQEQVLLVQELKAVAVQDDPLSSSSTDRQQEQQPRDGSTPPPAKSAQQQKQQQSAEAGSTTELALASAAAAAAAAAAAPAAGAKDAAGTSTAAAAAAAAGGGGAASTGSGGMLSGLFSRKPAPPPPVYVPLLPTPVNPRHKDETRMALTIAVNGCCIQSLADYLRPWQHLPSGDCDRFALVWESACLKELGSAVMSFLAQQALTQVAQKSIQTLLYTGLVGALALPMTLTTAMRVAFGSKWLVALRRAQAAGKMLAMQLAQGCHGGRPVTLIGCSMGARLVFHCLLELARLGLRGCVENVILLGSPVSCRPDRWCAARSVVAGRLINGYSVNDWTLGLLYRVHSSNSIWMQAAGMYKVEIPGVENVNLSRLVAGHQEYLENMDDILEVINMHDA